MRNEVFDKFGTITIENLKRDFFNKYFITESSSLVDIRLPEATNLDLMAYHLYGDHNLYWIIILANDFQDVFFDLPLTNNEIQLMAKNKIERDEELSISDYGRIYEELMEENDKKRLIKIVPPHEVHNVRNKLKNL